MVAGILLTFLGTFLIEVKSTQTKKELEHASVINIGFISTFFVSIFFGLTLLFQWHNNTLFINPSSFLFLWVRTLLEVLIIVFSLNALARCERSAFAVIRSFTIPLLFMVDVVLGYTVSLWAVLGVALIIWAFAWFGRRKTCSRVGTIFAFAMAITAVFTTSLYKHSISVFGNSPAFDQFIVFFVVCIFFCCLHASKKQRTTFKTIKPSFIMQMGAIWALASFLLSYVYLFLNAGTTIALKRGCALFWALISGRFVFHEKDVVEKMIIMSIIVLGLILLFI